MTKELKPTIGPRRVSLFLIVSILVCFVPQLKCLVLIPRAVLQNLGSQKTARCWRGIPQLPSPCSHCSRTGQCSSLWLLRPSRVGLIFYARSVTENCTQMGERFASLCRSSDRNDCRCLQARSSWYHTHTLPSTSPLLPQECLVFSESPTACCAAHTSCVSRSARFVSLNGSSENVLKMPPEPLEVGTWSSKTDKASIRGTNKVKSSPLWPECA